MIICLLFVLKLHFYLFKLKVYSVKIVANIIFTLFSAVAFLHYRDFILQKSFLYMCLYFVGTQFNEINLLDR